MVGINRHPAGDHWRAGLHAVPAAPGHPVEGEETPSAGSNPLRRFPLRTVLAYNVLAVVHYLVGCSAVAVAYWSRPVVGLPLGLAYLVFSLTQKYVLLPTTICPGCVYRAYGNARCVSGINLLSARLNPGRAQLDQFGQRASGRLCHSNLHLCSLVLPVGLATPGLLLEPSWLGFILTVGVVVLAIFQIEVMMRRIACRRCLARRWCPTARRMKLV